MIQASLKEMGLQPEEAVFVGDSIEDIEAGKQAGVDVYALPTGIHSKTELKDAHPGRILKNLAELLSIVKSLLPISISQPSPHDQSRRKIFFNPKKYLQLKG